MKEVLIKIGTTGIPGRINHIACLNYEDGKPAWNEKTGEGMFITTLNPGNEIEPSRYNRRLSSAVMKHSPTFADKVEEFAAFIEGARFISFHPHFIFPTLKAEVALLNEEQKLKLNFDDFEKVNLGNQLRVLFSDKKLQKMQVYAERFNVNDRYYAVTGPNAEKDVKTLARVYEQYQIAMQTNLNNVANEASPPEAPKRKRTKTTHASNAKALTQHGFLSHPKLMSKAQEEALTSTLPKTTPITI